MATIIIHNAASITVNSITGKPENICTPFFPVNSSRLGRV